MKVCRHCGLPITILWHHNLKYCGDACRKLACLVQVAANQRRYRQKHRAKLSEAAKANRVDARKRDQRYRERHRDRVRELDRLRRLNYPDKFRAKDQRRYENNKDQILAARRRYIADNPEKRREVVRRFYEKHRDKILEYTKLYEAANPALKNARSAARRARQMSAMPKWVDRSAVAAIYLEARERRMSVDHIIPIKHRLVCGLHVPWNLQIIPLIENVRKNNRFDPAEASAYSAP